LQNVTVVYTSVTLAHTFRNGKLNFLKYLPRLLVLDFQLAKTLGICTTELGDQLAEALSDQLYLAIAH